MFILALVFAWFYFGIPYRVYFIIKCDQYVYCNRTRVYFFNLNTYTEVFVIPMPQKEPRAGCILVNKRHEILIVRNTSSGYWGFPKGGKHQDETHLQAAMRELHEEAGRILDERLIVTSFNSNKSRLFLAHGDFTEECRVDMYEVDSYKWVALRELKKLKTSKFTQAFFNRIDNAIKALPVPSF